MVVGASPNNSKQATVILQQPQKASCQPHKQGIFASFVLRHS
jgi:hypothetical protein